MASRSANWTSACSGTHVPKSRVTTRAPRLCIGCSGWNYKSWRTTFYPADLKPSQWLSYYATHFDTVEINNSFYRLPERSMFASWRRQVRMPFVFAVKASRYLTHMKRLRDPDEPIARLFQRASALGLTLGPVLVVQRRHFPLPRAARSGALPARHVRLGDHRTAGWTVRVRQAARRERPLSGQLHRRRVGGVGADDRRGVARQEGCLRLSQQRSRSDGGTECDDPEVSNASHSASALQSAASSKALRRPPRALPRERFQRVGEMSRRL